MRTRITTLVAAAVFAITALGAVFFIGMRTKSPIVLDAVRRASRASKRFVLPTAGIAGSNVSIVRHVGRTSGRAYDTPIDAVPTGDGFLVALPYGMNTDWLKNVLAAGTATIVHDGATHHVTSPQVVPMAEALTSFPANDQRSLRLFDVQHCLRLTRAAEPGIG